MKVLFLLIILGVVFAVVLANQFTKHSTPTPVSSEKQQEMEKLVKDIQTKQNPIIKFYTSLPLENKTKVMVFYELMGPLGGLDPIAKPTEVKDVHATINVLYGANFNLFNFSKKDLGYSVTAPIRNEYEFDEVDFFNKNEANLELLAESFENDDNLKILNWGYSTNYRINEYFGDDVRNFYWKINTDNSPFYSYEIVDTTSNNYQTLASLKNGYGSLIDTMSELEIQSIYKCENKIIIIVDGLSDNAFGYIYNAQSSSEVNCGTLKGRFRIYKDIVVSDKWRFWFAK